MATKLQSVGSLQKGSYIVLEGAACRVVDMQVSRPGKHGHAKFRIEAVGMIDGKKRDIVMPHGSVEVPIIENFMRENGHIKVGNLLEIGCVLYHYDWIHHEVIDRDELGTDLYTHKFTKKYDLIVSISTIEHMDDPRKSLEIIKNLLNPGGKAVITIPLGYNIDADLLDFNEQYFMYRRSWSNIWKQENVKSDLPLYNYRYPAANGILIGVING